MRRRPVFLEARWWWVMGGGWVGGGDGGGGGGTALKFWGAIRR